MNLELDAQRLVEFYGREKADRLLTELDRLKPFMTDPLASVSELVTPSLYVRQGFTHEKVSSTLTRIDIPKILSKYSDRVEAASKTRQVTVNPGDIADVLKEEVPMLDNRVGGILIDTGKRVYTGQTERPGSRPGYGPH